jgi:hypothetical protein
MDQSCNRSRIFEPAGDRSVQKTFQTGKNRLACHIIFNRLQAVASKANEFPVFVHIFRNIYEKISYHSRLCF